MAFPSPTSRCDRTQGPADAPTTVALPWGVLVSRIAASLATTTPRSPSHPQVCPFFFSLSFFPSTRRIYVLCRPFPVVVMVTTPPFRTRVSFGVFARQCIAPFLESHLLTDHFHRKEDEALFDLREPTTKEQRPTTEETRIKQRRRAEEAPRA